MNAQLFNDIKAKITAELPEVATVALWKNQFKYDPTSVTLPCILVEFREILYSETAEGMQKAACKLRLHVGFDSTTATDSDIFSLVSTLHTNIQDMSLESDSSTIGYSALKRTDERAKYKQAGEVFHYKVDYETSYIDTSTRRALRLVVANINTLEIAQDLDIDNSVIRTGDGKFL